jgi:protein O-mannosyl-transferase
MSVIMKVSYGQQTPVAGDAAESVSAVEDATDERAVFCIHRVLIQSVLLAILNVVVFGQVAAFGFVDWDDIGQVMNRVSQFEGVSVESLSWAMSNHIGGWMTPLTWVSLLIDRHFFGMNAGCYHLTNLVLHIVTSWCLFAALSRLTGNINRSFVVVCLFAIHPLHVEPVAWVTGRWELIAGLCWCIGLLLWSYFVRSRSKWVYTAVMVAYVAAVLGKPIALTFPFVLLLLDYWPLNRLQRAEGCNPGMTVDGSDESGWSTIRKLIVEKVPLFIVLVILSTLAVVVKRNAAQQAYTEQFSLIVRLGNTVNTYVFYLWQTLWPHDLACFYPHPASIGQFSWASVATDFAVIATVTFGVLYGARCSHRWGFLIVGWLYYLGTFVPASGIVQVELYATADRYTYIPLIGLLIMLVWGCAEICDRRRISTEVRAVAVTLCVSVLVVISCRQCATWRDSNTLWNHAATVRPLNYRAHSVLAYLASKRGDMSSMEAHSQFSVEMCPQYVHGPSQLGVVRLHQRRSAEAVELFRLALRHAPDLLMPRIALGRALRESGQFAASIKELEQVVEMAPSNELVARELALTRDAVDAGTEKGTEEAEALTCGSP